MKRLKIQLLTIAMFFPIVCAVASSDSPPDALNVYKTDGSVTSVRLDDFRKITFSGDNLVVHKTDNSQSNIALSNFQKIVFGDYQPPVGIEKTFISDDILAYYNGHNEIIVRSSITPILRISIFDINGRQLQNVQASTMNVSNLSTGIYFLQIHTNNGIKNKKIIISK